jgi:hypothetical protein
MKNSHNFSLVKLAKNTGGDRYVTNVAGKDWTVYFPQEISRPSGRPAEDITIVVHVGGINPEKSED